METLFQMHERHIREMHRLECNGERESKCWQDVADQHEATWHLLTDAERTQLRLLSGSLHSPEKYPPVPPPQTHQQLRQMISDQERMDP